jgi:hypothetical protein
MHDLYAAGHRVTTKPSLITSIKHVLGSCELRQDRVAEQDGYPHTVDYTGPLQDAPDGVYHLWPLHVDEPLRIVQRKLLLERLHLGTLVEQVLTVEARALTMFRELLGTSEKVLHVYQEDGTGLQQYMLLWPGDTPPAEYKSAPQFKYRGVADLQSGRVTHG